MKADKTPKKNKSPLYPPATVDALLKAFEAGQGHINRDSRAEISREHNLTYRQISAWTNDRKRRHGLYGELKFIRKLSRYVQAHPDEDPSDEMFQEFQTVLNKIIEMNGYDKQ
ncbi:unnamed protein product [Caenorhabditis sp. 36 PRJEB53466]|nr:unnamed protein product [Caenorhabditis sp. 36 PRJEB53466]